MNTLNFSSRSPFRNERLKKEIDEKFSGENAEYLKALLDLPGEALELFEKGGTSALSAVILQYKAERLKYLKEQEEARNNTANNQDAEQDAPLPPASTIPDSPEPAPEKKSHNDPKPEKKKREKQKKDHHKRKGHGRLGADDFLNAGVNAYPIGGGLCSGGDCPCGNGKLFSSPTGKTIRYEARPLLKAVVHSTEKLRCNACSSVFAAHLPASVTESKPLHRATPEAAATSILTRYGLGFPDKRLETLQAYQGHPLPDSTQWAISLEGFLRLRVFFTALLNLAANSVSMRGDDAKCKVISLQSEIKQELENAAAHGAPAQDVRTGVNSTLVVATLADGNEIHLSLTGREHQGEVCHEILKYRTSQKPIVLTTDAAAKASTLAPFPEKNAKGFVPVRRGKTGNNSAVLKSDVVRSFCLQHLRLRFEEVQNNHPEAVEHVLKLVGAVFNHERQIKTLELSATERLRFHQEHSQPVMNALDLWLQEQFREKRVEPNSDLGGAIQYAINQWQGFTEFLRSENVPLDTNACERDVYFIILHRNNSLHYQTANGAVVGDVFMGIVATCRVAKINPLQYMTALLEFSTHANLHPEKWLPWNYKVEAGAAKAARDLEWAEIDARRAQQGYRQCVRTAPDPDVPVETHEPHRYPKRIDLSHWEHKTQASL